MEDICVLIPAGVVVEGRGQKGGVFVPPVQSGGPGGNLTFQGGLGLSPAERLEGDQETAM